MTRLIPATESHAAAMAAIHAAAFDGDEVWSKETLSLHLGLPGGFGFIDSRGGFVLARTIMDEAEILTIAVNPSARRIGLGAGLMRAALDSAWIRDARSLFLEVAVHNAPALALYLGMGFQEVGRRPRYYKNGADALVLRCVLKAPAAESVN